MIINYIKLAYRNLLKNKAFSIINISGLAIGMAVCIVILLFVQYEQSFDTMHDKNIYRLNEVQSPEGMTAPQKVALSMYPMGPTLMNEFPEIKNYVRLNSFEMAGLVYKEQKLFFDNIFWADASFFDIFDFKVLKGDPKTALKEPNSVVLTRESAKKLFGNEEPMGKSVSTHNMRDTLHFTVTGIIENVPENSHLQFNGLYSFSTIVNPNDTSNTANSWGGNWVVTYLELAKNTDAEKLESRFPAYLKKYMGPEQQKAYKLFLQPLTEVHGTSQEITHDYNNFKKFDSSFTAVFLIIALIVLVIGCVNFINLSTARATRRGKEVGVRKTIGAGRPQLVLQFMCESLLVSFIAMTFAVFLVKLCLPFVCELSGHHLQFSFFGQPLLILLLIVGTCLVGLLSGVYPAFHLSAFMPVKALKGAVTGTKSKSFTRNVLVVVQFACAAFLIIATVFVIRQLNYMRHKDPGFNKDQVMIISGAYKGYQRLKTALEAGPLVKAVSGSSQSLGNNLHQTGFIFKGVGPARELVSSHVMVDEDFISLYGIKVLAGKDFTEEGNNKEVIVNESLARELLKDHPGASYETLIGNSFSEDPSNPLKIVGVVGDFNFNSLHTKIETLCLINFRTRGFHDVSVKIDSRHIGEAMDFVKKTYESTIKSFPYDYVFLDDHFAKLYSNDEKVSKVVGILGGLAIFIACLGLLGLASYSAETRVKEIGVRKVLGASVMNIVGLLSKDFVKLVLIANLLAWPLAWYCMLLWLRDYAYHINISWWVFVLSGVVSLAIALLSVSSQTLRAATTNPIKSLRTE